MARTRKTAIWVDRESSYGSDPTANGSTYLWIPALEISDLDDGKAPIPTNYFTGRNWPTAPIAGPDGGSFSIVVPLIGLATAAGDGTDASSVADDWLDDLLTSLCGARTTSIGEGVSGGSGASTLVLDAPATGITEQIPVPVYEAGAPAYPNGPRTQWAIVTDDASTPTFSVAPNWQSNPTTAAVMYGTKSYQFDDDGGATLAFVYREDDTDHLVLGARCTSASINRRTEGGIWQLNLQYRFDSKTSEAAGTTKTNLPAAGSGPAISPVRAVLSPFNFNGTYTHTSDASIDFGINAAVVESTAGTNGRAEDESIDASPSITVKPQTTTTLQALKRNATAGRMMMQLGAGVLSGGVLNTILVTFVEAVAETAQTGNDNGRRRLDMKFNASDPVTVANTTAGARVVQIVRA